MNLSEKRKQLLKLQREIEILEFEEKSYVCKFDPSYDNIWWITEKSYYNESCGYFDDQMRDDIPGMSNCMEAGYEPIDESKTLLQIKRDLEELGIDVMTKDAILEEAQEEIDFQNSLYGMTLEDARDKCGKVKKTIHVFGEEYKLCTYSVSLKDGIISYVS